MNSQAQAKSSGTAVAVIGFLIVSMAVNITMALHLRNLHDDSPRAQVQASR